MAGPEEKLKMHTLAKLGGVLAAATPKSPVLLGSATTGRRKPVPTPRNTLKKPAAATNGNRRDSEGQTSVDSTSPDDTSSHPVNGVNGKHARNPGEDGEDILAALEKIPGVGSLRSVAQSSIGSSLPSLSLDKVKREESSHSLGSQLSPDRQLEAMKRDRSLRFHTTARTSTTMCSSAAGGGTTTTSSSASNSPHKFTTTTTHSSSKCSSVEEEEPDHEADHNKTDPDNPPPDNNSSSSKSPGKTSTKTEDTLDVTDALDKGSGMQISQVQTRPLPDLPKTLTSPSHTDDIKVISVPEERVYSSLTSPDHYSELQAPQQILPVDHHTPKTRVAVLPPLPSTATPAGGLTTLTTTSETASLLINETNYLTMTGTMKKGRKKKKKECVYDIQMSLTREQVALIEKKVHDKYHDRCFCGIQRGIHVLVFTILCFPVLWPLFTLQSFYLGTLTWYNVFLHYNEDRTCCHKLLSPFILLAYPLWIIPITFGLGLFGAVAQISWYYDSWIKVVKAPDCGFLGWLCNWMDMPECSPYQVVLLTAQDGLERPLCGGGGNRVASV